ncbi:hypothetical protein [Prevotella corporis]|uniref:hypothetical protein n=1 Tax=Prevotella corporis TaxID=28128 RepID=UPI00042995AA|nr:hypothetical protein [Prevotella corporis]
MTTWKLSDGPTKAHPSSGESYIYGWQNVGHFCTIGHSKRNGNRLIIYPSVGC